MRTYFDNAPEEEGTQLILSGPLTADEEAKVRALGADYQEEHYAQQFESAWVNCGDGDEKEQIVQLLASFGITEETVDNS